MTCGVYILYFENDDGKYYVGYSNNVEQRYKDHCRALKKGNHHSKKLQKAYDVYSILPIEVLLEETEEAMLEAREIYYIALYDSFKCGYNHTAGGEGASSGENHVLSVYSDENVIKAFLLLVSSPELTQVEIAEISGISTDTVNKISSCTKHCWLENKYPKEYNMLRASKGNKLAMKRIAKYGVPILIAPDRSEHNVCNIREFASMHGLDAGALTRVINGVRYSHKKWILKGSPSDEI